jgi:hypothetical protein
MDSNKQEIIEVEEIGSKKENYQFVKELDEQTKDSKHELLEGGFNSLYFEVKDKKLRRDQYIEKLQLALDVELKHYTHQMDIISKSSLKTSESLYEELITKARAFRDNFLQVTHLEVVEKFQEAMDKALIDYEDVLNRVPMPNHENELINNARRQRIEQATHAYTRGIEAMQKIFNEFQDDWHPNETVLKVYDQ